jgi:hypothetical protein
VKVERARECVEIGGFSGCTLHNDTLWQKHCLITFQNN